MQKEDKIILVNREIQTKSCKICRKQKNAASILPVHHCGELWTDDHRTLILQKYSKKHHLQREKITLDPKLNTFQTICFQR